MKYGKIVEIEEPTTTKTLMETLIENANSSGWKIENVDKNKINLIRGTVEAELGFSEKDGLVEHGLMWTYVTRSKNLAGKLMSFLDYVILILSPSDYCPESEDVDKYVRNLSGKLKIKRYGYPGGC